MYAAHHKVDNIIAFVDYNGQQIDGPLEKVMNLLDLKAKWKSFGWLVLESDGNDLDVLSASIEEAQQNAGKGVPVIILMKTNMGHGVDFMMGSHKWHGVAPNDAELEKALLQLEETMGDY